MVGHGAKFGRKKEEAIAALLTQPSIEQAARVAGVGPKTLLRWLKLPEFQAAYREARRAGSGFAAVVACVPGLGFVGATVGACAALSGATLWMAAQIRPTA